MTHRVGFRCDAGVASGVGHLMRCVALAEELCGRGAEVLFLGEVAGSEWAASQLRQRGFPLCAAPAEPEALVELVRVFGLDAVVLDSYVLAAGTGAALRAAGTAVLAIIDGDPLGQDADLYLDQNLGAELRPFQPPRERAAEGGPRGERPAGPWAGRPAGPWGERPAGPWGEGLAGHRDEGPAGPRGARLAGARYALLRDSVLLMRGTARRRPARSEGPLVLCFFGGTDSAGVAPAWAGALCATGLPFRATVVSPVPFEVDGPVTVIPPTDRLPGLMAEANLVVTAAGSTVWELLHLGVPTALSWVADNQLIGYEALVGGGIAAGLGPAPDAVAVGVLARLLADPAARDAYGRRGAKLIDGRGRERVADALLALL
ncbi:PseG/SpsG family protein [Nonomuraea sp. NPDC049269]|uniref:PseG/SpsG family protein n=1 Tax=Nonomuraea sp. NPDC049269 TaxID=3364349 RepID=UPI00371E6D0A